MRSKTKSIDEIPFSLCFYLPAPTKELVYLIMDIPGDSSQYHQDMAVMLLKPLLGLLLLTLIITSQDYDLLIRGDESNILIVDQFCPKTEKEVHTIAEDWLKKKTASSFNIVHIEWVVFTNLIKHAFPLRKGVSPETLH